MRGEAKGGERKTSWKVPQSSMRGVKKDENIGVRAAVVQIEIGLLEEW